MSMVTGVALSLTVAALVLTNPTQLGPIGVTLWFVALFLATQGVVSLALFTWSGKSYEAVGPYQRLTGAVRQGSLVAGVVTVMLALSSLRQLSLRDAGLLILLAFLVEIFFKVRQR
jgi:hypothetical protein